MQLMGFGIHMSSLSSGTLSDPEPFDADMPSVDMPRPRSGAANGDDGLMGAIARFWQRSYAAEYTGFALLLVAYMLIQMVVEPFHRMFSLDNISIHYPHAAVERVSVFWNIVYAVALPLCIILLWALVLQSGFHKAHVTILGLAISVVLTTFLTDVVKNAVGRPRPDLLARCKPKKGTPQHELITIEVCTETDHHVLHDGWRSFPSGHSSLAFSGLGFLALFFAGQMHVFRPRSDLAKVLVALAPLIGAAMIAISRLEDYRHDVYDITVGSVLGFSIAYFSYKRHYPSLTSFHCHQPYPSRADVASLNGSGDCKDEEGRISSQEFPIERTEDELERLPLRESSRDRQIFAGRSNRR